MERGRPTKYTEELEDALIDWIAHGKTLREFCRQEGTPSWRTVYNWLEADADFSSRFARARELGQDAIAEEAMQIADTPVEGEITTVEGEKVTVRREDMLGHRKLQIETRLKLLAKWNPKKWGERTVLAGDPSAPLTVRSADDLTDAQLAAIAAGGSAAPPQSSEGTDAAD